MVTLGPMEFPGPRVTVSHSLLPIWIMFSTLNSHYKWIWLHQTWNQHMAACPTLGPWVNQHLHCNHGETSVVRIYCFWYIQGWGYIKKIQFIYLEGKDTLAFFFSIRLGTEYKKIMVSGRWVGLVWTFSHIPMVEAINGYVFFYSIN